MKFSLKFLLALNSIAFVWVHAQDWKPADNPLMTRWATEVRPDSVHAEYPRPQMQRETWINLNGLWEYAVTDLNAGKPEQFDGRILVPFPIESALSGVKKEVGKERKLWYRRSLKLAKPPTKDRILLHFGAVDWECHVWVNGQQAGSHRGGYDPFFFDITGLLKDGESQELLLSVWDPSDQGYQPRGKQVAEPRGIWYTANTGIWQTVWLEQVPIHYISSLKLSPDLDHSKLKVEVETTADSTAVLQIQALDAGVPIAKATGPVNQDMEVTIPNPRLWSPDSPFLYDLQVDLLKQGRVVDSVRGYFGMRKISLGKDEHGFVRMQLNNEPLFQFGPLDQGWWPDGLYTAPTDEALKFDVVMTKNLGFNMIRKHVKVEPARWYYHCDRLGVLVWQDMPNGDRHIRPEEPDMTRSAESEANFYREWRAIMESRFNHPSIVVWVPFNEGWGQFKTDAILEWTQKRDPSRLVDGPSGWADRGTGDMNDMHRYPGPGMPEPESDRAVVLGEFGGLGWPVPDHLWWDKRNWGYRTYQSQEDLEANYITLIRKLKPLVRKGLAAAVYTQTTDVEGEVNGLMTYDRKITKLDPEFLTSLHAPLYASHAPVKLKKILPTSETEPQLWKITLARPGEGWTEPAFNDSSWSVKPGGFGEVTTPGSHVGTEWKTKDIWLRKSFQASKDSLYLLRVHHDEDAEIYLNGYPVISLSGYTTEYMEMELDESFNQHLISGTNTLAVHCRQTDGGQYLDLGLFEVVK